MAVVIAGITAKQVQVKLGMRVVQSAVSGEGKT